MQSQFRAPHTKPSLQNNAVKTIMDIGTNWNCTAGQILHISDLMYFKHPSNF